MENKIFDYLSYYAVGVLLVVAISLILLIVLALRLRKMKKEMSTLIEESIVLRAEIHKLELENRDYEMKLLTIGHELKNPLADSITFFESIESDLPNEIHRKIRHKIVVLFLMIDNLVTWTYQSIKNPSSFLRPVQVYYPVTNALDLLDNMFLAKKIQFNYSKTEAWIVADERELEIVLRNIFLNVLKFTPEGGTVYVKFIENPQTLTIRVTDNGIGMNKQQLQNIFNSPKSRKGTNGENGLGIGIMLSKKLTERQNGSFQIQSLVGTGTTVELKFPLYNGT